MSYENEEELFGAIVSKDVRAIRELLNSGKEFTDEYFGLRLMSVAVQTGDLETMKALLANDQFARRLNNFDDISYTVLSDAVREGDVAMVKLLLEAGADINAHNEPRIGNTALREAVGYGRINIIEVLLEAGADPGIKGWMQINAQQSAEFQFEKDPSETNAAILALITAASEKLIR